MKYHPDIELLLKYASGHLKPSLAIAIGLHQQQCSECQQTINELEIVGGNTLEKSQANATLVDAALLNDFDKLMQDIQTHEKVASAEPLSYYDQLAVASSDLPLLDQLANQRFDELTWQRIGLNIWRSRIAMNDPGFEVELLKFSAHTKIPKHTHRGNEFTLVLQGDFSDHQGHYKTGEFISQNQHHNHQPVAGENGCICLAITDAPLKFTGTLGPVLNWFNR